MSVGVLPFRVMLVEDNPDDEKMTLRALKQAQVQDVFVARDGAQALDYIFNRGDYADRAGSDLPLLILLDLKLPKISGMEVLEQIRGNHETTNVPVVVLTSSDEDKDILQSYNLRANSYVRKPVEYDSFMATVKGLGLYWTGTNLGPRHHGVKQL
jgi:two-component system, response regulator